MTFIRSLLICCAFEIVFGANTNPSDVYQKIKDDQCIVQLGYLLTDPKNCNPPCNFEVANEFCAQTLQKDSTYFCTSFPKTCAPAIQSDPGLRLKDTSKVFNETSADNRTEVESNQRDNSSLATNDSDKYLNVTRGNIPETAEFIQTSSGNYTEVESNHERIPMRHKYMNVTHGNITNPADFNQTMGENGSAKLSSTGALCTVLLLLCSSFASN